MRTQPLIVDGLAGPLVVVRSEWNGTFGLTLDGRPVPRTGRREFGPIVVDGRQVTARIIGPKHFDPFPVVEIGGVPYRTGPLVPVWLTLLTATPLLMVLWAGPVGMLAALPAMLTNRAILVSRHSTVTKVLRMLVVIAAGVVLTLALAIAFYTAFG